jgi:hypothetical protein
MRWGVVLIAVCLAGCTELLQMRADCTGEAAMREADALKARSEAVATRWNRFRSGLSGDQAVLLDQLRTRQEMEARNQFVASLSAPERTEVAFIIEDLQAVKSHDAKFKKAWSELHHPCYLGRLPESDPLASILRKLPELYQRQRAFD